MITKLKVAICDDEPILLKIAKEQIERIFQTLEIKEYSLDLYSDGIKLLESEEKYHLLLLDIDMPEINGLTLAKKLTGFESKPLIILLTSHTELMAQGFHVKAFRFLTKPIKEKEFYEAISSALKEITFFDAIILEDKKRKQIIDTRDIVYIESLGEGCCIHTKGSQFMRKEPLKYWKRNLPNQMFIQTHRAYIVNLKFVKSFTENKVYLKIDEEVPLSVRKKKVLNDALHEFVRKKARR